MKYSLLYRDPSDVRTAVMDASVLYDLSADRLVRMIAGDARRADYFLQILSRPLTDPEDIRYRQEILADFRAMPQLYEDLKTVFNRYDKVKLDWQELRSSAYPASSAKNYRALLEYTFASLKVTSLFPKTIISFFSSIRDVLSRYEIKASGLTAVRDYCEAMCGNDSLNELASIASNFQYYSPEQYHFDLLVKLDDTLRLSLCELCGIREIDEKGQDNVLKRLFRRKTAGDGSVAVTQDEESTNDTIYLLNEALHQIDAALTRVTGEVYEIFYGISRELWFYDAALEIVSYCEEAGVRLTEPVLLPDDADETRVDALCDLMLLCEGKTAAEVTTNTVKILPECDGLVIHGLNKSGKTSFLRALGTARIFAQGGLPVCAKSASFSVRRGIFSHFSSAEEEFKAGDTAGRFEGEVQLIAKIVDSLVPYSVIYLNETFQTTSYTEGADGIYHILRAMPRAKTKYAFVTKLTRLPERMAADTAAMVLESGRESSPYSMMKS